MSADWINAQERLTPNDPLLTDERAIVPAPTVIHSIRHGVAEQRHPVAEAIHVGEAIVAQFERDGRLLGSPLVYFLFSLRDVIQMRERIKGVSERLERLREENWKATLYELLVAASYAREYLVELMTEESTPTPDIRISSNPQSYAECKAKLRYEELVTRFVERWRRDALGGITSVLVRNRDDVFNVDRRGFNRAPRHGE